MSDQTMEIFNKDEALENVGGLEDLLQELAGTLSEELPTLLEGARKGIADGNANAVNAAAHSIKGSVTPFAGKASYEAAWKLEQAGSSGDLSNAETLLADLETELEKLQQALKQL